MPSTLPHVLRLLAVASGTVLLAMSFTLAWRRRKMCFVIWRELSVRIWCEALGLVACSSALIITLLHSAPWLQWGWLSILPGQSSGNLALLPVVELSKQGGHLSALLLMLCMLALFLFCVPVLAWQEEMVFRKGKHGWHKISCSSVAFGLSHLIVGIPLAAAFGLIAVGFLLARRYRSTYDRTGSEHSAVLASAALHTAYNSLFLSIMFLLVLVLFAFQLAAHR